MTPHPKEEDREWEKEFDRQFPMDFYVMNDSTEGGLPASRTDFKSFISSLLTRTRADERKRIREKLLAMNEAYQEFLDTCDHIVRDPSKTETGAAIALDRVKRLHSDLISTLTDL